MKFIGGFVKVHIYPTKKKKKLGAIILSAIILPKVLLLNKFNGQRHQIYSQINIISKPRE